VNHFHELAPAELALVRKAMTTIAIEQLPASVQALLKAALRDTDALMTEREQPIGGVSRLNDASTPAQTNAGQNRRAGGADGLVVHMAPDFDEPVDDFGDL